MVFTLSKADKDIWMRKRGNHYEYIAVYVDDVIIASEVPEEIIKDLKVTHGLKLKGTGAVEFHLGCNYFRDSDGVVVNCTLC